MTPHLHVVMNNQFRNMKQVVEQLHIQGYRRIGFAMPSSSDERVDHNYLGGFWIAQQNLPSAAARLTPLLAKKFNKKVFFSWFKRARPDAIVVAASLIYQVIDWLKEENMRVPEDIGLAVASVPYRDTTISGIDENVPSIGAYAVDAVVAGRASTPGPAFGLSGSEGVGECHPNVPVFSHNRSPRRTTSSDVNFVRKVFDVEL